MDDKVDYRSLKKGGFMRQKQKDHFSLRLAVTGGMLTAANLKKVAAVSEKYGKGYVHLTSRQGVEIPFISFKDIDRVKQELAEGGCQPRTCGPRVRTITACQGNQVCLSGNIDSYRIASLLNDRYFGRELPHKFKFGVTGCQNNCLKAEENDIGIKGAMDVRWKQEECITCGICKKICRERAISMVNGAVQVDYDRCSYCGRCVKSCPADAGESKEGFLVSFGGTFGNRIRTGQQLLPLITSEKQLFRVIDAAISFFEQYGQEGERFGVTIDRIGQDVFYEVVKGAYNG